MKVLVACDSFKDCMDAISLNDLISRTWLSANPQDECSVCAIADGGEGTTAILVNNLNGYIQSVDSYDPLMRPIEGSIGWVGSTAIVEVASASGLQLLSTKERNPWNTTSYGTGILIRSALAQGAKEVILGLGGSATNDVGIGLLQALGGQFYDSNYVEVPVGAQYLANIDTYDLSAVYTSIQNTKFTIASDVTNPLLGKDGASEVFSRQKGASESMVHQLELGANHINALFSQTQGIELNGFIGGGAAGGIGAIAQGVLNGRVVQGIALVISVCDLERRIQEVDLIITGEGKLDNQSLSGKAPIGILNLASRYNKKVVAICGTSELSERRSMELGFSQVYALNKLAPSFDDSINNAPKWIKKCVELMSLDLHRSK